MARCLWPRLQFGVLQNERERDVSSGEGAGKREEEEETWSGGMTRLLERLGDWMKEEERHALGTRRP